LKDCRDPTVAKRIRFFSLEPLIAKTFDQDKSKTATSDYQDRQGRPSLWKKGVDVLRKHVGISKKPGDQDESVGQYPPTLAGLEQALVDAGSCWSNVREFSAKWWDAAELQQLGGFLHPAWSTFGPSLRKVTLAGSPASIRTLLSSAERLPSLCELRFELTNSVFLRVDNTPDVTALEDAIAPFINSVSPTLEVLSISSWGASIDLSQFFLKLGVFPRLRRFNARVPFNKAFANTPDGLTRLLHDHSHNLTSVGLRLNPAGAMIDPSQGISLRRWMESINSDHVILSNLTTLEMYPGSSIPLELINLDAGELWSPPLPRVFLDLLKRSADTLKELAVRDRYLSYEEVESVLSTFASRPAPQRLTVLCLNVRALSLRLLDLLSRELPCLRKLSLYATREDWIDLDPEHDGANSVRPLFIEILVYDFP